MDDEKAIGVEFTRSVFEFHFFLLDMNNSQMREEALISDNLSFLAKILKTDKGLEAFLSSSWNVW
jgi:hypothetical protein